ncbi:hypothetical protein [Cryobacterium sp. N22]|uniref:hypothetical protein n=1 Tax=Cryobacterium sp. N22 TaxID=2048290 RepID=UPI000CE2F7EF|nr:hypothetical protein [Cryobacterium sp. N22]
MTPWLVRHPLTAGWLWVLFWFAVILVQELAGAPTGARYPAILLAALPTLTATLFVLAATPRSHLQPVRESVLAHFFVRFLALIAAFIVWGATLAISASIEAGIQEAGDHDEATVTGLGFTILLALVPVVIGVLWLALIVRCAWFLRRLRGWRQLPARTPDQRAVPAEFLRDRPELRAVAIGLAHPGLLLVGGAGSTLLVLSLGRVDLSLVM